MKDGDDKREIILPVIPGKSPLRIVPEDDQSTRKGRPPKDEKNEEKEKEENKYYGDEIHHISDVFGHDDIIRELIGFLDFRFGNQKKKKKSDIHGFLIYGTTGVGKSLIVEAVYFDKIKKMNTVRPVILNGSDLIASSQAKTAQNIRFFITQEITKAKNDKKEGVVIIIDEFDSLAGSRGSKSPIIVRAVQELLSLDLGGKYVAFIATTNLYHKIDSAILGRFMAVEAFKPDIEARLNLVDKYFEELPLDPDRHMYLKLSEDMEGWVGRDISKLADELEIYRATRKIALDYKTIKWYMENKFKSYVEMVKQKRAYGIQYEADEKGE